MNNQVIGHYNEYRKLTEGDTTAAGCLVLAAALRECRPIPLADQPLTGYVTCDLCPAVCIVAGLSHEKAHEHWQKYGRPTEFSLGTCAPDAEWRGSNVPPSSDN